MDAVLTTIKPIVQGLVENELKTVIEQNIDKIDTIEPTVDAKLGEVAGKIKALIIDNINKIPFVPDSIKQGFISQIPVDKLIEIINGFDFEPFKATLLAIPTTGVSDPAELNKIKTTLTGLPDKIKSLLIKHIESVFNGAPVPTTVVAASTTTVAAPTTTTTVAEPTPETIQAGLNTLSTSEKEEVIKDIMELLNKSGVLEEIKKQICTPAPPATTPSPTPVGGANKKKRRKTKKNIRRQNRSYTKFGRTF
jgi:hypothetical protein